MTTMLSRLVRVAKQTKRFMKFRGFKVIILQIQH